MLININMLIKQSMLDLSVVREPSVPINFVLSSLTKSLPKQPRLLAMTQHRQSKSFFLAPIFPSTPHFSNERCRKPRTQSKRLPASISSFSPERGFNIFMNPHLELRFLCFIWISLSCDTDKWDTDKE